MMKAVSISTADRKWLLSNYGGFLQHFALRVVLKRMGYSPFRVEAGRIRGEFKAFLRPLLDMRNNLLCTWSPNRAKRPCKPFWFWLHRLRFIRDYRKMIGKLFEKQPGARHAAIVGGGQAWSIYCQNRPDLYWEDRDDATRRIAYSVSSAWVALKDNDEWKARVGRACAKADSISLRERAGAELCAALAPAKDMAVTLDPVFLLSGEEYGKYMPGEKIFKTDTLLCYFVEVHDAEYIDRRKFLQLSEELGCDCRMVGIQGAEFHVPPRMLLNPGPVDFLRCCRDAKYIVTNSFHGAVLAMVFQKDFLFVGQRDPDNTGNRNLRQVELLNEFGLADRAASIDAPAETMKEILDRHIDWKDMDPLICAKRTQSLDWLRNALEP